MKNRINDLGEFKAEKEEKEEGRSKNREITNKTELCHG